MVASLIRNAGRVFRINRIRGKIAPIVTGIGTAMASENAIDGIINFFENLGNGEENFPLPVPGSCWGNNPEILVKDEPIPEPNEKDIEGRALTAIGTVFEIPKQILLRPTLAIIRGTAMGTIGLLQGLHSGITLQKDVMVEVSGTLIDPEKKVLFIIAQEIGSNKYIIQGQLIAILKKVVIKGVIYILIIIIATKVAKKVLPIISKSFKDYKLSKQNKNPLPNSLTESKENKLKKIQSNDIDILDI